MEKSLLQYDGDLINHWYIICLSRELPSSGKKPISRQVYEKNYVIYRDAEAIPVVMLDRCPHRGAQLSRGTCHHGTLRCPYHGWTFGKEGRVCEIPSEGPNSSQASTKKQGEVIPCIEQDGALWVWIGDPSQKSMLPSWRFPEYKNPGWSQYFMITDFTNEVTNLVENFMDVSHTVFVHSKWFRSRRLIEVPLLIEVDKGRVKATYQQKNDSIGFAKSILNPTSEPMIHTDEFIFPNITRVDYNFGTRHFIINSQCTPLEKNKTRVYTWISYRLPFIGPFIKPLMQFYTRKVITQDVEIMENQGANLKRDPNFFSGSHFSNTAADELHIAIEKLRQLGTQDRQSVQQIQYSRKRLFWI